MWSTTIALPFMRSIATTSLSVLPFATVHHRNISSMPQRHRPRVTVNCGWQDEVFFFFFFFLGTVLDWYILEILFFIFYFFLFFNSSSCLFFYSVLLWKFWMRMVDGVVLVVIWNNVEFFFLSIMCVIMEISIHSCFCDHENYQHDLGLYCSSFCLDWNLDCWSASGMIEGKA